jgi:hypothetical protein
MIYIYSQKEKGKLKELEMFLVPFISTCSFSSRAASQICDVGKNSHYFLFFASSIRSVLLRSDYICNSSICTFEILYT